MNAPLSDFIFESGDSRDITSIINKYWDFLDSRRKVTQLIYEANYFLKTGRQSLFVSVEGPPKFFISYKISPDRKFVFKTDLVAEALQGIDIDRLQICEACKKYFWVNRVEKRGDDWGKGCSVRCNQVLRTRKKRRIEAETLERRSRSRVQKD